MARTLREVRAERGLSARQLAMRAGCAYLTVLKAEGGRTRPSPAIVRRLSDTLRVAPGDVAEFRRALCLPGEGE